MQTSSNAQQFGPANSLKRLEHATALFRYHAFFVNTDNELKSTNLASELESLRLALEGTYAEGIIDQESIDDALASSERRSRTVYTQDTTRIDDLPGNLPDRVKFMLATQGQPSYKSMGQAVAAITKWINLEEYAESLNDLPDELHNTYAKADTQSAREGFTNRLFSACDTWLYMSVPPSWRLTLDSAIMTIGYKKTLDQKVEQFKDAKDFIIESNSLEYYENCLHKLTMPAEEVDEAERVRGVMFYFTSAFNILDMFLDQVMGDPAERSFGGKGKRPAARPFADFTEKLINGFTEDDLNGLLVHVRFKNTKGETLNFTNYLMHDVLDALHLADYFESGNREKDQKALQRHLGLPETRVQIEHGGGKKSVKQKATVYLNDLKNQRKING